MRNNKSINIYMGIIGEAYVDKETAYAVLLAAKKNILDVQAIIEAANALNRPLTKAQIAAEKAITDSVRVYNKLKDAIALFNEQDPKFAKLYALLSDLNENDFDDNFSNGGNIFTARENLTFAQSLDSEIHEILVLARDLLDANKLNAVVRCKEYNIAKELFEAMIPEKIISPEDISDTMEVELLKRINAVRNNIDYVNLVSDEISSISDEISHKIDNVVSGTDEVSIKITNETLYWYAGNICPYDNEPFMTELGFTLNAEAGTYVYKETLYNEDGTERVVDVDFGIDGPLRANKWFHQPLHLIQDGQLIAGVDGGKAKYDYWYVAVPRYIPTAAGSTEYVASGAKESGKTITEWAAEHSSNKDWVDSLYPCKPQDYEHIDDAHGHPIWNNEWIDANHNDIRDEDADHNNYGYKLITTPDSALSINGILYDVWETPVTMYNKQRLNVYFNFGEPQTKETVNGLYWYIGKNKPTYESDILHEEGWEKITTVPTAEAPLTHDAKLDSKIFYIAIPKGFGIFNEAGVDLTNPDLEAESPYTIVYTTLIGKVTYNVYITGNEASTFADKIYLQEGKDIEINPDEPEDDPDDPQGEGDNNQYWYAGTEIPTKYNINHIANGSYLSNPNWSLQSIAATNNTGDSANIYYCFPEAWNVVVLDSDKVTEMSLASEGTFVYGGITYIVLKTGRKVSNGTSKDYYANSGDGSGSNPGGEQGGDQGGEQGGDQGGDQTTYYWYAGTVIPTAENLASIASGTETEKPNWNAQDISVTNNTGDSANIYYCFPEAWNVIVLDTDKATEVALPSEGIITVNDITYNVKRTGRPVSNGTVKELYAKC